MPDIGSFDIPVAELDLAPAEDPEKDERIPYVFLGGLTTNYYQTAALSMALGMEDRRVFALTYPEQKIANPPKALIDAIAEETTFKLHAEILKQTAAKLGTGKMNLVGYSMGTGVLMEAMKDPAFAERVNDLVLLEPIGLVEKSLPKIAKEFLVDQAFGQTFPNVEDRIKGWLQGDTTSGAPVAALKNDVDIIRKKQFDAESLSRMAPSGSLQVWFSPDSPLMNAKEIDGAFEGAARLRRERGEAEIPQNITHVKSATHAWPLVHAIGLAGRLTRPRPSSEKITELAQEDLDRTYAQKLLKGVMGK
ncbi:MAG: alpha/beta fold hydrolase, partial [Patescibacteria group bacterium]